MKDWRGNEYDIGSTVLYPRMSGRSCEMQEGIVSDVYTAYYCPDTYRWKRLKEGMTTPLLSTGEPADTETRVQIKPTRSSRDFSRWGEKPVTITILDNITAVTNG